MSSEPLRDRFDERGDADAPSLRPLRIAFESADPAAVAAQPDVLAVIGFGPAALPDDPRCLRVGLEPVGAAPIEVWRGGGPVRTGQDGEVRWAGDGDYTFFSIQMPEDAEGGIGAAAEQVYRRLGEWLAQRPLHVLRLWNYFDAINEGDGDAERYRRFCTGRVAGMQGLFGGDYPAATVIGRQDGVRSLQVYGLAARRAGRPVENPRQLSAWRYPRDYGPTAPRFARAMRTPSGQLLISGTAAIVGHASRHRDDVAAQLDETLANLDSVCAAAGTATPLGDGSVLKVYVRRAEDAAQVSAGVQRHLADRGETLVLIGEVCRRELLVEIDGSHG